MKISLAGEKIILAGGKIILAGGKIILVGGRGNKKFKKRSKTSTS